MRALALAEVAAPEVPVEHRRARDVLWDEAVRANPWLFDAPAVACVGMKVSASGEAVLRWATVPYRDFALRFVPGATEVSSLFVTVLQPVGGGVLVGRSSRQTTSAGRWQFPGGTAEPPRAGERLDADALAGDAARELAEETGLDVGRDDLRLHAVTRDAGGSVGVHWVAPPVDRDVVDQRFGELKTTLAGQGRVLELEELVAVERPEDAAGLPGGRADYLDVVLESLGRRASAL